MKTVEPGIYPEMSNEEYHASEGISKSGISLILESPLKYKSRYIDLIGQETTPAMVMGSATHTAVFEPEKFDAEYAVCPKCDKRTKEGKAVYADFLESAGEKTVIGEDDSAQIKQMREAVYNHPVAGPLVSHPFKMIEHSIYCQHSATGLLVKIRPDCIIEGRQMIVDLKTTTNASAGAFSSSCVGYTYHIQAGMYLAIARQHGIDVNEFVFVAVEKTAPFSVGVYRADKEMIALGYDEFERAMELYAKCMELHSWPGYNGDQMTTIGLPTWAARMISFKD